MIALLLVGLAVGAWFGHALTVDASIYRAQIAREDAS